MADLKKQGRSWIVSAALIAAGAVVGYNLPQHAAEPVAEVGTVRGVSPAPGAQIAVAFQPRKGSPQHFTVQAAAVPWKASKSAGWNYAGNPSCLSAGSVGKGTITLGVVDVHEGNGSPRATSVVAWVKCYG